MLEAVQRGWDTVSGTEKSPSHILSSPAAFHSLRLSQHLSFFNSQVPLILIFKNKSFTLWIPPVPILFFSFFLSLFKIWPKISKNIVFILFLCPLCPILLTHPKLISKAISMLKFFSLRWAWTANNFPPPHRLQTWYRPGDLWARVLGSEGGAGSWELGSGCSSLGKRAASTSRQEPELCRGRRRRAGTEETANTCCLGPGFALRTRMF